MATKKGRSIHIFVFYTSSCMSNCQVYDNKWHIWTTIS